MEKQYEVQVLIRKTESGYWATVAQFPGLFAAGKTHEELVECLNEALELYLEETGLPPELEEEVQIEKFSLKRDRLVPV